MYTPPADARAVRIDADGATLDGDLLVPPGATGIVVFAHGSGSSRFSPRNRMVARTLNDAGMATLLVDLLTPGEELIDDRTRELRFDIPLLADRLAAVTDWVVSHRGTADLAIAFFGASTGAAAALIAAAMRARHVAAVVSRGGRPDLAADMLGRVQSPTLLIVGGLDGQVIELNRAALARLRCEKQMVIVPGATHLFEEPGALEQVAMLAREWFAARFPKGAHVGRHE
ncbi:MAG TPA: hypothetical protein VK933_09430 [Longimicrobiales bacterium]|nr:hypothetical protein [Longimicrobiales bacterium]